MLNGADVLLIVPAFAPFSLNGNTRVGTVYMVVLKNIVCSGYVLVGLINKDRVCTYN